MTAKIEVERFILTTSKLFDEVVACKRRHRSSGHGLIHNNRKSLDTLSAVAFPSPAPFA
jgi:hypothetical protein